MSKHKEKENVNLDVCIGNLQREVIRTKKIPMKYMKGTLNSLRGTLSSQKILPLIQCFGQIAAAEPSEVRIGFVNQIWKKLKNSEIKLDVSHYNALLNVYTENEYKFSPSEILKQMEQDQVKPNRVTFRHFLNVFCREGDLTGASQILKEMKEASILYNENIFHELILGHCMAKDINGAESILNIMREKNMDIGSSTYATYLCGLAKSGNMEKFEDIFKKCKENKIAFHSDQLMHILYNLTVHGHTDQVSEMISSYSRVLHECAPQLFLKLLGQKQYDMCAQISNILMKNEIDFADDPEYEVYHFIAENEDFETIKNLATDWEQKGYGSDFLVNVLYHTLKKKELFHKSLSILRELYKTGQPVKEIYFWPMLATFAQEKSTRELLNLLMIMRNEFGIAFSNSLIQRVIFNNLPNEPALERSIYGGLRSLGLSRYVINEALALSCYYKKRVDKFFELSEFLLAPRGMNKVLNVMMEFPETRSPARIVDVLKNFIVSAIRKNYLDEKSNEFTSSDAIGNFSKIAENTLHDTMKELVSKLSRTQKDFMEEILQEMISQKLPVSKKTGEIITKKFDDPEIAAIVDKLTELPPLDIIPYVKRMGTMNIDESDPDFEIHVKFLTLTKNNMIDEAEKIIEEHPYVLNKHFVPFLKALKRTNNEEKFNEYFMKLVTKIREEGKEIENSGFLQIELIKKGFLNEACMLIGDRMFSFRNKAEAFSFILDNGSWNDITTILNTREDEIPVLSLKDIVSFYATKENFERIIELLEKVEISHPGELVLITNLIRPLVNKEKIVLLKKVINVLESKFPLSSVMNDLVFAYVCIGDFKKAQECIDKGHFENYNFLSLLRGVTERKTRIEIMENVLNMLSGRTYSNKLQLYEILMEDYEAMNSDPKKGLALWEQMQDENMVPSRLFLAYLAKLLTKKNMTIPFDHSELEQQAWIFKSNISRRLINDLLQQYHFAGNDGISRVILLNIKKNALRGEKIQQMLEILERTGDEQKIKNTLRHCLSLARYKEAFNDGRLLQHAREVSESTDPNIILNNIPHSFLIDCLLTEVFDRIPNEVAQILMWACCHEMLKDLELAEMYKEKIQDSVNNRTVVEGVLKYAPYLMNKDQLLQFLKTQGIFDQFGLQKEVNYVLNVKITRAQRGRIDGSRKSQQAERAQSFDRDIQKEAVNNEATGNTDDGEEFREVVWNEETQIKEKEMDMEKAKANSVPTSSSSV